MKTKKRNLFKKLAVLLASLILAASLQVITVNAEEADWINFLLICNEGMSSRGGNSGNTMMVIAMNPQTGQIHLASITWDTFMEYEGYDLPQRIDMAYRNNGPEEAVKVVNDNLDLGIEYFMSLNYLNLATLTDAYGGVTVPVTRAERNALNAMVASKKENILASEEANLLSQIVLEMVAQDNYLNDFGPETNLNGMQAIAYGWLQYDSVYNCCVRDLLIVSSVFKSVAHILNEEMIFYTDEFGEPEVRDNRRLVNLDHPTDADLAFISEATSPMFDTSYNNLPENDMMDIALSMARASYLASRQGVDIMDLLEYDVFPLEAKEPYDNVAGTQGHLIDYEENSIALKEFLYKE